MDNSEILKNINIIAQDIFDDDELELNLQSSADTVDEWDSLNHIQFMIAIEKQFNIKMKNSEIAALSNVEDLIHLVSSKVSP